MSGWRRRPKGPAAVWGLVLLFVVGGGGRAEAQPPGMPAAEPAPGAADGPQTRAEAIEQARREKAALLWPEHESPLVRQVNGLLERGLKEGLESGEGASGPQFVLGGMRSGQGFSAGVGYARRDLWRERLAYRATVRGTVNLAYMLDADVDFKGLRSNRSFLNWYSKFESSPRMDYYGTGTNSNEEARTSYLYEDFTTDLNFGFEPVPGFRLGLTGGFMTTHVGRGKSGGVPSIEEVFDDSTAKGLNDDPEFLRWGTFLAFDHRDLQSGPRSGGFYGARFRQYSDIDLNKFSFRQSEFEAQYYIPYFNKSRVIALRASAVLSFRDSSQQVPFYLQPTLGGNDDLRGFERYRFTDDHAVFVSVEHRWHAFTGLDTALFFDTGKVTSEKKRLNFSDLKYSGGIGFRVRLLDAVVSRIDFAVGREGFRWMWTFSDINKPQW
ncbi:MAG: BamA/TamA family outer membrane protein [Acidobacteriota bacterium]|nr:BamA/TamA family outer membrane protein [Acidobacteriota bacterium]